MFENKKCLVIQGARQTGKTYIVERFAEENYEEIIEINFKQIPSAMDIFSGDLTVDNMVMAMSVFDDEEHSVMCIGKENACVYGFWRLSTI